MCGIGGTTEGEADAKRISKLVQRRGPDMHGLQTVGRGASSITLCHRRLSIIDLSRRGKQPLQYREFTISFNGEIYNYKELAKQQFPSERLEDGSDTEVLIRLYAKFGERCLPLLRGMWAFAIHDSKKQEMFFATDRFGKKPIYYSFTKQSQSKLKKVQLRFASEGRALLLGNETVNQAALDQYLELGVTRAPATIWNEIKKIEPATWMRISLVTGVSSSGKHWLPTATRYSGSYDSAVEELRKLLETSVRYRMVSDVPVGCFLSGGVDSSIVSAIAHSQKLEQGAQLHTFSIGFENTAYDESKYSIAAADAIGTNHHHETASVKKLTSVFYKLPQIYSEPFADSSALPTYLVSELARRKVTVSLSGDGADELFGGYRTYNHARRLEVINKTPLKKLLPSRLQGTPAQSYAGLLGASKTNSHLSEAFNTSTNSNKTLGTEIITGDWAQRLTQADITHYLPADILTKVDRASMMHALEVRCPFLDHDVAKFGLSLPAKFKIAQPVPLMKFVNKRILKDAYRTQLPAVVFDRPKQGFSIPEKELLQLLGERQIDWGALGRVSQVGIRSQARTYREYVLADWSKAFAEGKLTLEPPL